MDCSVESEFVRRCGCGYFYDTVAIVCQAPRVSWSGGRLHNEREKTVEYEDGFGWYALNGVPVPETIVKTTPEAMTREWLEANFVKEANVEVRREILRKIGASLFVERMGGKVLDREGEVYELLSVDLSGRTNAAKYLKMRNPSIGCWHVEAVPDSCQTVAEALHARKPPALRALPVAEDGAEWWQQGDVAIWPKSAKSVRPRPSVLT